MMQTVDLSAYKVADYNSRGVNITHRKRRPEECAPGVSRRVHAKSMLRALGAEEGKVFCQFCTSELLFNAKEQEENVEPDRRHVRCPVCNSRIVLDGRKKKYRL